MKIIINTATNAVMGTLEGVEEVLDFTTYIDVPTGFDLDKFYCYTYNGVDLDFNPDAQPPEKPDLAAV